MITLPRFGTHVGKTEQKSGVFLQLSDANARAVGSEEAAAVREMPLFYFISFHPAAFVL